MDECCRQDMQVLVDWYVFVSVVDHQSKPHASTYIYLTLRWSIIFRRWQKLVTRVPGKEANEVKQRCSIPKLAKRSTIEVQKLLT